MITKKKQTTNKTKQKQFQQIYIKTFFSFLLFLTKFLNISKYNIYFRIFKSKLNFENLLLIKKKMKIFVSKFQSKVK